MSDKPTTDSAPRNGNGRSLMALLGSGGLVGLAALGVTIYMHCAGTYARADVQGVINKQITDTLGEVKGELKDINQKLDERLPPKRK